MSRRVGFGDKQPQPSGVRRTGDAADRKAAERSGSSGSKVFLAIVVTIGALLWIIIGFGGPEGFAEAVRQVSDGEKPVSDLLAVILPAVFIEAAALIMLFRGAGSATRTKNASSQRSTEAAPRRETIADRRRRTEAARTIKDVLTKAKTVAKGKKGADAQSGPTSVAGRLFVIGFLSLWLTGWTTGMVFAFGALMAEWGTGDSLFLIVWLAFATLGWFFAVTFLLKTIGSFFRSDDG